jgi:hypothetical protein
VDFPEIGYPTLGRTQNNEKQKRERVLQPRRAFCDLILIRFSRFQLIDE